MQSIGTPPPEDRLKTLTAVGLPDIFGNGARSQHIAHLRNLEEQATDAMIVIMSDLQIDKPHVSL
jgi:hypothetical protein